MENEDQAIWSVAIPSPDQCMHYDELVPSRQRHSLANIGYFGGT